MSNTLNVEFEVSIPGIEHSEDDLVEWLRFSFGDNGSIKEGNPLVNLEPEPVFGTFLIS